MSGERRKLWAVLRWPALLAALSATGLLAALLGDGLWDALSWAALAVPVAIAGRGLLRASMPKR